MQPLFCPRCGNLVLNQSHCSSCNQWQRIDVDQPGQASVLWRRQLPAPLLSGVSQADGIGYVVDDSGLLHAFSLEDGHPAWKSPVSLGDWRVHQAVAVDQGLVVVGPNDPGNIPQADKAVLALDAKTGEELWRRPLAVRQISSPLIIGDQAIVALSSGQAAALGLADGVVRWREPIAGASLAAPARAGDLVIFGGDNGVLTARRIDDGSLAWTFAVEENSTWGNSLPYSAAYGGGVIYATCWNRRCYAVDAATGALRWASELTIKRPALTAPVLSHDALYFCARDRHVYCLDADTGQRRWFRQFSRSAEVAPLLAGDALFVAVGDRYIYRLDPSSGDLVGEALLRTTGKVDAPWIWDGQRIYLADRAGFVYALAVAQDQDAADPVALEAQGRWPEAAAGHAMAGDLLRAGDIYRGQLNSAAKAALLYERGGHLLQAAEQYAAAGDLKTARQLYRETGQQLLVAGLSEQLDDLVGAAQAYEAVGQWADAGALYERLQAWPQAAGALEQAGDAAEAAGNFDGASGWWERAAHAYQAAGQPEKAVQLYKAAGHAEKAETLISSVKDVLLARHLQRMLFGPIWVARWLEGAGQHVAAAEEYLLGEQPLEAARLYEAGGEYALASECFESQGYLLDAGRNQALAGNHNAAADLYAQGGDFAQAAQAYARASNHHRAAQTFEQISAWADAAQQWEAVERWDQAAAIWERAGQRLQAAVAWERSGELMRAAECYGDAAEEIELSGTDDSQAAASYEKAMLAYARCGAEQRARYCDRKRRFLRKQPWLEAKVVSASELVVGMRGKLVITLTNSGWGNAEKVLVRAAAIMDSDPVHVHAREFGLGRGLSKPQDLYAIPSHPGQLAVEVTVSYQDMQGNHYPPLEQTVELNVLDKDVPKGVTPAEIHVHGHYFAGKVDEVISEGVKIERHAASSQSHFPAAPASASTIDCARCGRSAPADAAACSHCETPFMVCRRCGLSLPRRMKHCMHCGQAL